MDTEILTASNNPSIVQRLLPAVVPVLLIAMGYVDPGKWAAAVEGGARFGSDLVLLLLVFNFAAILCQYLSARIAMVTGRDLSQICSDEYDKATCIFLGVLTEISMIGLDLTMILGIAQGLNLIFGVDLFTCVFLTAIDAILFPVFANLLDNGKVKFLCILMSSFVLLFYVLGVLFSQPEISVSMSGMLTKLSGESAFALMSLLGANVMPHNFYLHSSIIQQELGPAIVSKGFLFHDHFFAIVCIFSIIFMVNFVLMNAAANVFYSTGLLTFQDALSLMDQVFRSPVVPFAFLLVLFVSDQITALTWSLGRQAVLHDFFGLDIPGWLHHVTIRIIAIIPALCCVWNSGPEGIYQLMIFTQVVVALMLPSSVIPLFRIASSRSVMGVYKISQFMEFLATIVFFGMLGLKIIFLVEMIFGNSDWVGNLKWSVRTSMSVSYIVLLITASSSFCLMLWLAATPLKSATFQLDGQGWNWDITNVVPESSADRDKSNSSEAAYDREEPIQQHEPALALGRSLESHPNISVTSTDVNLPEKLLDSDSRPHLTTMEDNGSNVTFSSPSKFHPEESTATADTVAVSTVCTEGSVCESVHSIALNTESTELVEKTVRVEGDLQTGKDDEGDTWEPEESLKDVSGSSPSLTSEGPGSYRSLTGKSEDGGSGPGSFRSGGLGRAARRQLASVLDKFWGQLFDSHGKIAQEAKAKKLEVVLGIDSKVDPKTATLKVDTSAKEFPGYFPSVGGRSSDSPMNSSAYDSTKFLGMQGSIEASYGVQRVPSSSWSSPLQLLDAHVQNSSNSALNSGERRYSSLRVAPSSDGDAEKRYSSLRVALSSDGDAEKRYSSLRFLPSRDDDSERRYSSLRFPPSSGGNDYQPATVHGYNFSRIAKESSDYLNSQKEALTPKSPSLGTPNYRDTIAFSLGRRPQHGLSTMTPPGFSNPVVSRNTSLISERTFHDLCSPGAVENLNSAINTKKFHSLPDISGLSLPYQDSYLSGRSTGWETHVGTSLYPSTLLKAGASLPFDNLSPVKPYKDPFALQSSSNSGTGSLWSKQPFEQFGVAAKTHATGSEGVGRKQSSVVPETSSVVDLEAELLQSFRHCIMRLLKLEGSDWLFRQNDGADEDLIDRVAARERFLYEAEARETNRVVQMDESQYSFDRKPVCTLKNDEIDYANDLVSSFPNCGEGCVWRVDLIVSFGVWCIHRILSLSLTESRPEMWGKYTHVLNLLQGIIDLAFSKPRTPMTPCFCLQIPTTYQQQQQRSSPPPNISNGSLPPPAKQGKGKCTTAAMLLDLIKGIENAISCRKGRTGTAAGDVAFPLGRDNLASVLKRYRRRLSTKPVGGHEGALSGSRKFPASSSPCGF